jgi:hypothetical protein
MPTAAAIPVTVTPDAQAHLDAIGLQEAYAEMLEHTQQSIPGLLGLRVRLEQDPEGADDPCVVIQASLSEPARPAEDTTEAVWGLWKIARFPQEIGRHFALMTIYEVPTNGR